MERLLHDVARAVRTLARRRSFTALTILTLATGIAATTAIFSVVDGVLLRPLPYKDPARLYRVWQAFSEWKTSEVLRDRWNRVGVSYPQYLALRADGHLVEDATIYSIVTGTLTGRGDAERITYGRTTCTLLSTLGVRPVAGRAFTRGDEQQTTPLALVGYDLWRRRFGGDPHLVGQAVYLDGTAYEVVGIAPPALRLFGDAMGTTPVPVVPDLWVLIPLSSPMTTGNFGHGYNAVVRLRAGVDAQHAETALVARMRQAYAAYRPKGRPPGGSLEPLGRHETLRSRASLWLMLVAACAVLLVACGNAANLMLSEVVPRARELAVRASLGATRTRLATMLLVESLLLAVLAGACGVLLAWWLTKVLVAVAPPGTPNIDGVRLDAPVLAFSCLITVFAGVLFGLLPAWLATARTALTMREGRPTESRAGRGWQQALCAAQVALAVVVLASAALLGQSLLRLSRVDPGFNGDRLLAVALQPPRGLPVAKARVLFDDIRGRLAVLPGVRAVTQTSFVPFRPLQISSNPVHLEGQPNDEAHSVEAERRFVLPNLFDVVGMRVLEGRGLAEPATGACEIVVNRALARRLWPEGGAVGSRLSGRERPCTVVGVVSDVRERTPGADPVPTFYVAEHGGEGLGVILLRTSVEPESLIPAVRRIVRETDRDVPVTEIASVETLMGRTLSTERYRTFPLALFGVATLLLAIVGTYGVIAQAVRRETRALGVRAALGARPSDLVALVVRRAAGVAAIGVIAGLAAALGTSRLLRSLLFGVGPTDMAICVVVAVALGILTLVAGYVPARAAGRLDVVTVLRAE